MQLKLGQRRIAALLPSTNSSSVTPEGEGVGPALEREISATSAPLPATTRSSATAAGAVVRESNVGLESSMSDGSRMLVEEPVRDGAAAATVACSVTGDEPCQRGSLLFAGVVGQNRRFFAEGCGFGPGWVLFGGWPTALT